MSQQYQPPQPRRRRADRHNNKENAPREQDAPLRAGFPQEDMAPMPLGGYDASAPQPPQRRDAPQVYEEQAPARQSLHPGTQQEELYDDYYDDELPPRRWPLVLLSLLVLLILLIAGSYFLIPKNASGIMGQVRGVSTKVVDGGLSLLGLKKSEPPRLIKFDTPEPVVQTGVKTVFTFTADKAIDGVRIIDSVGNEIKGVAEAVDSPNNTTWTLTAILDKPAQDLLLSAGILVDKTWYQTDKSITLTVAEPTPTPEPATPSPAPEPSMTPEITQTPEPAAVVVPPVSDPNPTDQPPAEPTATLTVADLLPVFSPSPATQAEAPADAPEFPDEEIPEDMMVEFPDEEIPEDMLAEFPPEEVPGDMTAEQPGDEAGSQDAAETPGEDPAGQAAAEAPVGEAAQAEQPVQPQVQDQATPMPALTVSAAEDQSPAAFKLAETAYKGSKKQSEFKREPAMDAQGGELYTYYPGGVFTFRNDGMRQNAAFGTADMPLKQMSIHWQSDLGSLRTDSDTLYGLGWTSQPAIIKWSVEVRSGMNINDAKKDTKALKEVILGAQDGKIHFLDLADGQITRDPIEVGYPLKGSVTVDAFGRPLIAVGQGISKLRNKTGDIGYHFYNLIDQKRVLFINGRQTKNQLQHSTNGAFDATGLFERNSDSFVVTGENGLFYTVKLNTVFDFKNPNTLTLDPEVIYLRSKLPRQDNTGVSMEASPAMYGPYAFVADKYGALRCIDTTTMKTLWVFDTGDNTDATPALDLNGDGSLSLYTGTTVFSRSRKDGNAVIRRMDALTGKEIWATEIKAKYDNLERGGVKASPVVGQKQIGHLVIFTVNLTEDGASLIAFNKENGQEVWRVPVPGGAISSPVAVYAADGSARIVQAGLDGKLYLVEGATGSVLSTLDLGGRIEGSPAVYNDILVVGTSSKDNHKVYGIRLE